MKCEIPAAAIDRSMIVSDVAQRFPVTIPVFNKFGIDSCCGGGQPIHFAAERDGADERALLAELNQAVGAS